MWDSHKTSSRNQMAYNLQCIDQSVVEGDRCDSNPLKISMAIWRARGRQAWMPHQELSAKCSDEQTQ